jgi:hypothetical protein
VVLTKERPDPVAEPAPEHRVPILARGYEEVRAVVEPGVRQHCDRPYLCPLYPDRPHNRTTAEIAPTPATLCMKPLCDLSTHKFENWRWTTGRVCPEHNNGCTFALFPTGPAPLPFNPPLPFMPAGSGVRGREKPLV